MKSTLAILLVILLAAGFVPALAGQVVGVPALVGPAGHQCHVQCPKCRAHCRLEVEQESLVRDCYDVECEPICVPHVRFPWMPCWAPLKCAKTRLVNVLKKYEFECPQCKHKWTPVCEECSSKPLPAEAEPPPTPTHRIPGLRRLR
jgi:hypothetical protein